MRDCVSSRSLGCSGLEIGMGHSKCGSNIFYIYGISQDTGSLRGPFDCSLLAPEKVSPLQKCRSSKYSLQSFFLFPLSWRSQDIGERTKVITQQAQAQGTGTDT